MPIQCYILVSDDNLSECNHDYFAEVNSRKQKSFLQLHSERQELFQKGEFIAIEKYFLCDLQP